MNTRIWRSAAALLLCLYAVGCGNTQPVGDVQTTAERRVFNDANGKVFGDAFVLGGPRRRSDAQDANAGGGGIGVNTYLWRASLDTVAFMPLVSADPFGGVIITDWYTPAETPDERFKVTIYILDRDLRSDGVRASVFRQKRDAARGWNDVPVAADTGTKLEDSILTRARQIRIAQAGN